MLDPLCQISPRGGRAEGRHEVSGDSPGPGLWVVSQLLQRVGLCAPEFTRSSVPRRTGCRGPEEEPQESDQRLRDKGPGLCHPFLHGRLSEDKTAVYEPESQPTGHRACRHLDLGVPQTPCEDLEAGRAGSGAERPATPTPLSAGDARTYCQLGKMPPAVQGGDFLDSWGRLKHVRVPPRESQPWSVPRSPLGTGAGGSARQRPRAGVTAAEPPAAVSEDGQRLRPRESGLVNGTWGSRDRAAGHRAAPAHQRQMPLGNPVGVLTQQKACAPLAGSEPCVPELTGPRAATRREGPTARRSGEVTRGRGNAWLTSPETSRGRRPQTDRHSPVGSGGPSAVGAGDAAHA